MEKSQEIQELVVALIQAKKNFGKIEKNCKNKFQGNAYANLGEMFSKTQTALLDANLHVFQFVEDKEGTNFLTTLLTHASGQFISSTLRIPEYPSEKGKTEIQQLGSNITYLKRYQYAAILGLDADADLDGTKLVEEEQKPQKSDKQEVLTKSDVEALLEKTPDYYAYIQNQIKGKRMPAIKDWDEATILAVTAQANKLLEGK